MNLFYIILEKSDLFQQLESDRAAALEAEERFARLGKLFNIVKTLVKMYSY